MTAKKAHTRAEHALFPFPSDTTDDHSERDISWIYVYRDGSVAPKKWPATELVDEETLFEAYGGGRFTLKARNEQNSRWTASRELRLEGRPKPLNQEAAPEAVQAPALAPQMEVSSSAVRDGLAIASVLGPLLLQMMEASARRSEAQTNLMIQLFANKNTAPNEQLINLMAQAAFNRNPGQEQFAMLQQAMQLGMQLKSGDGDNTIEQMLEGFGQFIELQKINSAKKQNQAPSGPTGEPK